ncbi:conserved Plasmodium protein, unknown function [Plasmodium chabaudi chabaudi]|uniref:Uncharacterized protein n=1 Tax=Plasmodium chabaudi chabaudi TaxID=31271 RepID=A0A4V0K6R9_PLACU|nr:conserved Plasmodium protein, unknown function [Plasmodium chabaudi chabaudi]VTZ68743.1 conserved Plasmodium protein, unknown function [Plasmodium chabaudi chabaudi]|eukprot:XP_744553.2 conserved Plasmodium protein, unknown function [Plasmodium chabaudi chabaudi]
MDENIIIDIKKNKKKKKYIDNDIDKKKLYYINFICEEDDINFFCSFAEKYEHDDLGIGPTDNLKKNKNNSNSSDEISCSIDRKNNPFKFDVFNKIYFQKSYLDNLIENENIKEDPNSQSFCSYIYSKFFLKYCKVLYNCYYESKENSNLKNKLGREIYFFTRTSKKRIKLRTKKKNKVQKCRSGNSNNWYDKNECLHCLKNGNKNISSKNKLNKINNDFILSPYIAYTPLENSVLEYYMPHKKIYNVNFLKQNKLNNENGRNINICEDFNICDILLNSEDKDEKKNYYEMGNFSKDQINFYTPNGNKQIRSKKRKNKKSSKAGKTNDTMNIPYPSSFFFDKYTSSDDSSISFSNFLPNNNKYVVKNKNKLKGTNLKDNCLLHENDGMLIFSHIINLCKQNKIFSFKKNKYPESWKNEHRQKKNKKKRNNLSNADSCNFYEIASEHINEQPYKKNISSSKCEDNLYRLTKNIDKTIKKNEFENTNLHILSYYHKKRSFSTYSLDTYKDNVKISPKNKMYKNVIHKNNIELNMQRNITKTKIKENQEMDIYYYEHFLKMKQKNEQNKLKKQILKGLKNQTKYDPSHLEDITNKKLGPMGTVELNRKEYVPNLDLYNSDQIKQCQCNLNGVDSMHNQVKQHNVISLKLSTMLSHKFCSLYICEKYETIIEHYKYHYIYIDFYLTYIYLKALIKLKKYNDCLKCIFDINRQQLDPLNKCILYFFLGACYEKLYKYKLSTSEYSKLVIHGVSINKNKHNIPPNILIEEKKEYKKYSFEIYPFLLICLDKLIGTYQLNTYEENNLLKYFKNNYIIYNLINFYTTKMKNKINIKYDEINSCVNTHNEINFDEYIMPYGDMSTKMRHINMKNPNPCNFKNSYRINMVPNRAANQENKNSDNGNNIGDKNYFHFFNMKNVTNSRTRTNSSTHSSVREKRSYWEKNNDIAHNYNEQIWEEKKKQKSKLPHNNNNTFNVLHEQVRTIKQKKKKKKNELAKNIYVNLSNILYVAKNDSDYFNYKEIIDNNEYSCLYGEKNKSKNLIKKLILVFDKIISKKYAYHHLGINYDDLFFYILYGFFQIYCKNILNSLENFAHTNFLNQNIYNFIRKLGLQLKLVNVYIESSPITNNDKIINQTCIFYTNQNKYNLYKYRNILHIDTITLEELICINMFCLKKHDFVNSYYISKYILKREKAYDNEEAIILYITSLINIPDIIISTKNKIKELLLLFHKKINYIKKTNKSYYYKPSNYVYVRDYLDYFIYGIIYFLKNDFRRSSKHFNKCIKIKKEFYLCYVYLLKIALTNNTLIGQDKKLIFFTCFKLRAYNVQPYLIYFSHTIKKIHQDLYSNKKGNNQNISIGNDNNNEIKLHLATRHLEENFSKAINLDNDNIFLYNELFVYSFLKKDFSQCETIINKYFHPENLYYKSLKVTFSASFILYNSSIYNYICAKKIAISEKYLIKILNTNPFDIRALNLLTHILFTKKDMYWIHFFDYSMYLENILYSKKIISYKSYMCNTFFNTLKQMQDIHCFITYYKILKNVKRFYKIFKNYIKTRSFLHAPNYNNN